MVTLPTSMDCIAPRARCKAGWNTERGDKPFAEFEKEFFKIVRPTSLLKRFITTEEVASLVAYVCSPLASATNGAAREWTGRCLGVFLITPRMLTGNIGWGEGHRRNVRQRAAEAGALPTRRRFQKDDFSFRSAECDHLPVRGECQVIRRVGRHVVHLVDVPAFLPRRQVPRARLRGGCSQKCAVGRYPQGQEIPAADFCFTALPLLTRRDIPNLNYGRLVIALRSRQKLSVT
jgi:hypothetical protein